MAKATEQFRKALHCLDRGQVERGEEQLRNAIALAEAEADKATITRASCCLGELLCQLGRIEEGRRYLRSVASMSEGDDLVDYEIRHAQELLRNLPQTHENQGRRGAKYDIEVTTEAEADLGCFRKSEQKKILEEIDKQLRNQAGVKTRNRKPLRPNHVSEWELRIGNFRVFYDIAVEAPLVKIVAIGYKKRNKLFFRGREYES